MTTNLIPAPGQIANVRQRRHLVEDVVSPERPGDCHLVRLSCIEDDAQGQPLEVLWEAELDAQVLGSATWDHLGQRGFDPPRLFSAYLHTLRWNCVTATNPKLFQAPFRAGIRGDAYQLEPLRKALLLPRVNLFIADDVGLGKTIEAGLIARELLMRKKVRDIVVACPPSVLPQWQDEMDARFGLTFEVIDRDYLLRIRRERGYATNPFATHTRFLISHRLLIDEDYTGPLRDWLEAFRPGSLLILDEAHHAAPASGSRYAIDSKITHAIRDLAPRFEHRLFLSATPHNGHSNSFSALLEILDPQRFCRGVPVKGKKTLEDVMVRRLKEDIRSLPHETVGSFPARKVIQIDLDHLPDDTPELRLSVLLDQYRQNWEKRLENTSARKLAVVSLLISGLQQRLLSSVEAFARTLRVHQKTIQKQKETGEKKRIAGLFDLVQQAPGADDDRATLTPEELEKEEDAQFEASSAAIDTPAAEALRILNEMAETAEKARYRPDARIRKLVEWIRKNMMNGERWTQRRVLIFTEYEDTLRYLRQQLENEFDLANSGADRAAIYQGSTPAERREEIKRAFNGDPAKHPLRILLATDAAREGINLQSHCVDLFHFDVPWNPSRMEQRNGRIDRKLQPSPEVRCHYFVYVQRAEDRVLQAIVRKTETIKKELGSLSQVIEGRLAETLSHGIRHRDARDLERQITDADLESGSKETVIEELEASRDRQKDLADQIDRLRDQLEESKKAVGMDLGHFQEAISCALELIGSKPLEPVGKNKAALSFPPLDQREGGDSSWANTLDGLRTPRERGQTFWEWRRQSTLRPVVFSDPGVMTEEVVHLHLEHRVVQRLLGRFNAQGFVYNDLSRACLAQTNDAIPRVVLIGRLCLYGAGAARLHEALIHVTARWVDPRVRKGKLTIYGRDEEGNSLQLLEDSLRKPTQPTNAVLLNELQINGPRDVEELLPELLKRGEQLGNQAEKDLSKRGQKEAQDMQKILEEQKKRIAKTIADTNKDLKSLFDDLPDEKRQLEADRRHWDKRIVAIEQELKDEPERIRAIYDVKARRIEPVGLVYLWPATG